MIYYCFRETEDWINKGPYQEKDDWWGYNKNRESKFHLFKEFFDLWNETQLVSYFQFRHELKKLAKLSFEDAGIPEIPIDNWRDLKEDDWIIPQDDDDWVAPNLKSLIEEAKRDVLLGDVRVINSVRGFGYKVLAKNRTAFFPSCGQAFRMGMLKKHFSETDIKNFLRHHNYGKWFLDREKIPYVTDNLSITACRLLHTGSASYMFTGEGKRFDKFSLSKKLEFNLPNISNQPVWCRKYMKEFKKLTECFSKIKML
jgi:hypothetical protein